MRKLVWSLALGLGLLAGAPANAQQDWLKKVPGGEQAQKLGVSDINGLRNFFGKKQDYPASKQEIVQRTDQDPTLSDRAKGFVRQKLEDRVYKNPKDVLKVLGL
jgi:hypothetical protein